MVVAYIWVYLTKVNCTLDWLYETRSWHPVDPNKNIHLWHPTIFLHKNRVGENVTFLFWQVVELCCVGSEITLLVHCFVIARHTIALINQTRTLSNTFDFLPACTSLLAKLTVIGNSYCRLLCCCIGCLVFYCVDMWMFDTYVVVFTHNRACCVHRMWFYAGNHAICMLFWLTNMLFS